MTHVRIDGVEVFHVVEGDGLPVVLLHGGISHSGAWKQLVPVIAGAGYRVHAFDRAGHGRTRHSGAPFSYTAMTAESIRYLEEVVGGAAHLVGWSDGAVVALRIAAERRELVRSAVLIDQFFSLSGSPGVDAFEASIDDAFRERLRASFARVSPDAPERFDPMLAESLAMWRSEPLDDPAMVARVTAPVLLLNADRGEVRLEHAAELLGRFADARLAILPGTHTVPLEAPERVADLVLDHLERALA